MASSLQEFVFSMRQRTWARLLMLASVFYLIWFTIVLYGEQRAWTDNPAAWAGMSTAAWGWLGVALFSAASIYYLFMMVRKEVPPRVYIVPDPPQATEPLGEGEDPGKTETANPEESPSNAPPQS